MGIQSVMSVALTGMSTVFPLYLAQHGVHGRQMVEFLAGMLTAGASWSPPSFRRSGDNWLIAMAAG